MDTSISRAPARKAVLFVAAVLALALVMPASAFAGDLTLHPNGFGTDSYSAWKAKQGEADSTGGANEALYFQKFAPTADPVAAIARIQGLEGEPTSALQHLAFDYRNDGHCGAGAPRFNVTYAPPIGPNQTFFVGCQAMLPDSAEESGWTGKTYDGPFPPGTIVSLAIVFDEGNDQGQGFVYLDNIEVNDKIWTSAADNGNR